ncbi:MAG: (Fe-S)-binding protein [Promethearchaeota archaeon]
MNDLEKRIVRFNFDACDGCGICFHKCPVLNLPIEESKKEIQRLIEGVNSKYVLYKCNTCFSCNLYCPNNANPYQLILERWNDLYKIRGAPSIYRFVCPTESSNIWQLLNIFLSPKERKWIMEWMLNRPKSGDNILLISNYIHLFPFIIGESKLLDYFTSIDKLDHWEAGAYLYQGGYLDVVQKIALKTKNDFDKWGIREIVAAVDSVEYMLNEIHPKEMQVLHDQKISNLNEFILNKIETGEIKLTNKLNMNVTVHDNCYSKTKGDLYWNVPREILKKCGCNIIEMKHIRQDSLCCGFGAGASWVKNISIPFDIISEGIKKFEEAEATGASALVAYCGGCIYLLWATKELLRKKIDVYHIIEIVRMAMGEKIESKKKHIERAWDIIAIISYSLLVSLLKHNFYIKKISYDKDMTTFKPKRYLLLRIMRILFKVHYIRKIYSKLFILMMPLMKTRLK